ncbi:MAG: adenylate/guanylate cyclase domain-containing protein [Henriciella sp.]
MIEDQSDMPGESEKRRLASVLVADICGFSTLAEKDEDVAIAVVRRVSAILTETADTYEGRLFHEAADGFFFEFSSANQSMLAAREMLVKIAQDQELAALADVSLRIGMHLGDVQVLETGNLLGHGVNVAARLQQNAKPGAILASTNLISALSQKRGRFWSKRKLWLKNLKTPVIAFNISDNQSQLTQLRDMAAAMPLRVFGSMTALVAVAGISLGFVMSEPRPDLGPIDTDAVTASLHPLIQAGRPVDEMVSALIKTNDFDAAIAELQQLHASKEGELTREQSLDLLHQVAAISVYRDAAVAETVYLEILKLDPFDAEALLQMSRIYRKRDFEDMALGKLQKALGQPALSGRMRLKVEIDLAELQHSKAAEHSLLERFDVLADEATELNLADVAYQAQFTRLRLEYFKLAATQTEQTLSSSAEAQYRTLIAQIADIAKQQSEAGVLYDVSETLATLSTMQNRISDYEAAQTTLTQALEIEQTLRRPARRMAIHANLAYMNVAWNEQQSSDEDDRLEEAERHVEIVRDLAEREGLTSREYYNWYILALVENQRGNAALSCSHFEKAIRAWPEKFLSATDAQDMASDLDCLV